MRFRIARSARKHRIAAGRIREAISNAELVAEDGDYATYIGTDTRGVELESVDDIDERQIAAWMKQVAAVPGVGGKKR